MGMGKGGNGIRYGINPIFQGWTCCPSLPVRGLSGKCPENVPTEAEIRLLSHELPLLPLLPPAEMGVHGTRYSTGILRGISRYRHIPRFASVRDTHDETRGQAGQGRGPTRGPGRHSKGAFCQAHRKELVSSDMERRWAGPAP